jgi:hypothetical protein
LIAYDLVCRIRPADYAPSLSVYFATSEKRAALGYNMAVFALIATGPLPARAALAAAGDVALACSSANTTTVIVDGLIVASPGAAGVRVFARHCGVGEGASGPVESLWYQDPVGFGGA